jgi:antitoxin component YwqK of YwqJK toxin-antitoxin module
MNCQLDNFIKLSEFFNSIFFCDNENKLYFKKNKKNLLHIKWYKNGCIKIKCYYKNGKKDGKFQRWLKNGYLVEESDWKDDIKI